jgi:lipoprotein
MKKLGYISVLTFVLLLLMCSCSRLKSKYDSVKEQIKNEINDAFRTDFYSDYGAWDYYRVPLIAPYELTAIDDRNEWHCEKRRNIDKFDYYSNGLLSARLSVEYAGISDSIIYLNYTEELTPLEKMPGHAYGNREMRRFVIIDVSTDSVEWHETREEWLIALNNRGVSKLQLHDVDSLYDDFANNRRLLFNPPKQ